MSTGLITHPYCLDHRNGWEHPECPERLSTINESINTEFFQDLIRIEAKPISRDLLVSVHDESYISRIETYSPAEGQFIPLDPDTSLGKGSLNAALYAAGAVITAIDSVMEKTITNGFCAVRPPGHHALSSTAMGFCLFNNIALGAQHLLSNYNLKRIAIIDFDVHHGNGTDAYVRKQSSLFFCSSHQFPYWPGSGDPHESGCPNNILNIGLPEGSDGTYLRSRFEAELFPSLVKFKPEFILLSAGFDAHRDDPLGGLSLTEADYEWITQSLRYYAETYAAGRLVSSLEGGYNLKALGKSVAAHLRALMAN